MPIKIEQTSEQISEDRWKWEIHLDGEDVDLEKIEYVEYTLHPTFLNPVRKIRDKDSGFKLETSGWGTFSVYLRIKLKDQSTVIKDSLNISFANPVEKRLEI